MRRLPFRSEGGFTLMEAVLVIVIIGIIGGMVAVFIRAPVLGYVQSVARVELGDEADTALRRIGRDVRLALANSVRVKTGMDNRVYLEFLLTKTGGRYLTVEDGAATGTPLSFSDTTSTTFTVVGPALPTAPTDAQTIVGGDMVVVYNLGPGMNPANAYADCAGTTGCNRATVASVSGNDVTLVDNPFAAQATKSANLIFPSPDNRFAVIEWSPVTYVCDKAAKTLTRYWSYAIQETQPADVATDPLANTNTKNALLAKDVMDCSFSYDNTANLNVQRTGLVGLSLTLQDANGETVTLFHQVHVDNTP